MPALRVLGGQTGLGVLQGVLSLPKQSAGHRPAYSTLFEKTAALFRSMILNHPFVDGKAYGLSIGPSIPLLER